MEYRCRFFSIAYNVFLRNYINWMKKEMKNKMKKKIAELAPQMYSVLKELQESASYWSEYDVPIGIVDRINDVLEKVENVKKVDTIKTTFDLRTCFVNMQNNEGVVILDKTQWEEICKLLENENIYG
jgi:hypothetical protein